MYASRTTQFIVGIFAVLGIAALGYLSMRLGRIELFPAPGYTLDANFDKGVAIDSEAIAAINTSGLIGDKYVAIELGGGDPLKDGATIRHTQSSFILEKAIGQLINSDKGAGGSSNSSEKNPGSANPGCPPGAANPQGIGNRGKATGRKKTK